MLKKLYPVYTSLLIVFFFIAFIKLQAQGVKTTEKYICELNQQALIDPTVSISNNMRRIAFRIRQVGKQVAVINGVNDAAYDSVTTPIFSPDSKRYAYLAKNGGNWFLVENGIPQQTENFADIRGLQYHPDSKSILYVAGDDNRQFTVINGVKGNPYKYLDENSIRFGAGGKIAYTAIEGNKHMMVFDGKEGASYERVGYPVFSLKGNRLGYTAKKDGKEFVVIDNEEGKGYDSVEAVIFSDNGQHFVYHVFDKGSEMVVHNGAEGKRFKFVHSLLISNDGSKVIYAVETETKNSEGFFHNVVVNGEVMPTYETVVESSLRISNNKKRLAYEAEWHDEFFVVLDGKNGKHYGDVLQSTITISPNSKRIAYAAENNSRRVVSVDDVEGKDYDDIYSVIFSPNSKWVIYVAKTGAKEFVVVNAEKGIEYDSILGQGGVIFDSKKKFHYLAIRDNKVYQVEEKIK